MNMRKYELNNHFGTRNIITECTVYLLNIFSLITLLIAVASRLEMGTGHIFVTRTGPGPKSIFMKCGLVRTGPILLYNTNKFKFFSI